MTPATDAFKSGKLADAVAAAIEQVRNTPADRGKRMFLAELFCFTGDLERADNQLNVLFQPDAPELMVITLFRQLLRGETARREVFVHGRVPEFIAQPPEHIKLHLEAAIRVRENRLAEANELLTKAETLRPAVTGTCAGTPFDDFRDLDDLVAPILEVITANGNYYWVATNTIELLEFHKPERTRDLYWRPAHLIVTDGPDGIVYIPALYPGSHAATEEAVKLGRRTDWSSGEAEPYRGLGLREFLVGDSAKSVMEIGTMTFNK
ncbi:MAG TPA: type VI secretion system accessory protein TagJ [Gemmata sp.]|jgi:type VI secretion system protein ImpE|nr:type VI secretion system accessory protein TagJ [Gemmata sp.]